MLEFLDPLGGSRKLAMTESLSIELRNAVSSEAAALSALAKRSKAHWPYSPDHLAQWHDDLTVTEQTIADTHCTVVLMHGQLAGYYVLDPRRSPWSLEHFWVDPEHMGRGVGRALLEHAVAQARAGAASAISIDSDPYAEPFYLACGAQRVGELSSPISGQPARIRPQLRLPL